MAARVDLTETPDDVRGDDEERPDFSALEDPETVVKGGPIRERLLDVILQVREPTKVSRIAELADCDTETAREYLGWFAEMGMVGEIEGRPVQYERNDSYWRWRRVERIRDEYTTAELVEELAATMDEIEGYRERFGAETPDAVSLTADHGLSVEAAWDALSEWQTLERRASLLDAARRSSDPDDGRVSRIDV